MEVDFTYITVNNHRARNTQPQAPTVPNEPPSSHPRSFAKNQTWQVAGDASAAPRRGGAGEAAGAGCARGARPLFFTARYPGVLVVSLAPNLNIKSNPRVRTPPWAFAIVPPRNPSSEAAYFLAVVFFLAAGFLAAVFFLG